MPELSKTPTASMPVALNDAEARIAKLEALLADKAAQEAHDAEKGWLPSKVDAIFGKNWSTSFWGVLAGAGTVTAVFPDSGVPVVGALTLHQIAGGASALGVLMLGLAAKSKNVTGVDKPK